MTVLPVYNDTGTFDPRAHDYVTVVEAEHPINKHVTLAGGNVKKRPARQVSSATATTFSVSDLTAFKRIYEMVSESRDMYLILGFIKGTEDGAPFTILSRKELNRKMGREDDEPAPVGLQLIDGEYYATRTKANFTSSSIMVFDYDRVIGMPNELETNDRAIWRSWLYQLLPGLSRCGYLVAPSTTSRVLLNNEPAFESPGWHMYVQVRDGSDVERFGRDLLIHSMGTEYGFMRPIFDTNTGEVRGHRPWTILDPTTFSRERAVYEGAPIISGEGLALAEVNSELCVGPRFDTSLLQVSPDVSERVKLKTGLSVERAKRDGQILYALVNRTDLRLDTVIDTENGAITVAKYWLSDYQKLRAQAPFRPDSTSQAAYINRHDDGVPFMFDVGIQTKYVLSREDTESFGFKLAMGWVESSPNESVKAEWTQHVASLNVTQTEEIRQAVHRKTGAQLQVLKNALNEAKEQNKVHSKQKRLQDEIAARVAEGRTVIRWHEDSLNQVVRDVKQAMLTHSKATPLFNYGGIAATIKLGHPTSVRQIQRKHELGDEYPEQFVTFQHTDTTMQMRIQESVSFQNGKEYFVGCPQKVSKALLDDPSFAPPLAGMLEVPSVTLNGELLNKPGYDPRTGYFMVFDKRLGAVDEKATKQDAQRAVSYLKETVFAGFPFASELDADCAVAFMLTAFVRRFLSKAPGFMVTATTQASGKSTLVDTVFHAAFGRPAAASSWTSDQTEMQKHITAILLEGHSGVNFDNLPYGCQVDGDELAKLLTQPTYSARILGKNSTIAIPTNMLVSLTGNHLVAKNDMPSRLVPIYLQPQVENPEQTRYERMNIDAWHEANRADIVHSVCSILVAWHREGVSSVLKPSRFPEWDECVRQPLNWLGLKDPAEGLARNAASDPLREARSTLLSAWFEHFGDTWISLKEVRDHSTDIVNFKDSTLGEAMSDLFEGKVPNSTHMGNNFRYLKDNIFGGLRLEQQPSHNKSRASRPWRVVPVSE